MHNAVLSSSRLSLSRRRCRFCFYLFIDLTHVSTVTEADEAAFKELADRVTALEDENSRLKDATTAQRQQYENEINRLIQEVPLRG